MSALVDCSIVQSGREWKQSAWGDSDLHTSREGRRSFTVPWHTGQSTGVGHPCMHISSICQLLFIFLLSPVVVSSVGCGVSAE
jgi:hypothetical protein